MPPQPKLWTGISKFTFQGDILNQQTEPALHKWSEIQKYTLEIQEIRPKYSLRCTSDQFSIVRNFWTGGRIRPLEKAKSISIEFPKWWEHYPIDQGNARGGGGWLKMMIGGFLHQFQGASAIPGSAGEPITLTLPGLNWQLLARSLKLKPWYIICVESLSPEFEPPNLRNGRDLRGRNRIYSLEKISGGNRFLGALPPQPLCKFRGRTHTWTGWSYLDSGGIEWVQGGLGSVPRQFQGCSAQKVVAGESITLTVIRLNWRLFSISLRLKPWHTIYIESLSPEVDKSNLKNSRMLRGRNRIYSLMKI